MAETRRMHYVPKTYLKRFSKEKNGEFYIHALAKEDDYKLFNANINNICVERDLYALDGETIEERQLIENMYHGLYENKYDNIYNILTDNSRVSITYLERYSIIGFVVSMFFRNNSWPIGYNKLMDETYAKAYQLSKQNNQEVFYFGEQEVLIAGKTLEELQNENRKADRPLVAVTAAKKIFELIRLRVINDVITVFESTEENEYITSDNPVIFRSDNPKIRPLPIDPSNTLSIPINANCLLQLRPWGHMLDKNIIGRMPAQGFMSIINSAIYNQAQYHQTGKYLLGSESGIKNFKPDPNGDYLKSNLRGLK